MPPSTHASGDAAAEATIDAAVARDAKQQQQQQQRLICGSWSIRRSVDPAVEARYASRVQAARAAAEAELERHGEVIGFGPSHGQVSVSTTALSEKKGPYDAGRDEHRGDRVRGDDHETFWRSGCIARSQWMLLSLEEKLRIRTITVRSAPHSGMHQVKIEVRAAASGKWKLLANWTNLSVDERVDVDGVPDGPLVDAVKLTITNPSNGTVALSHVRVTGFADSHVPTEAELREEEINAGLPHNLKVGDVVYSTRTRQRGTVVGWNTLRRTPARKAADREAGKFYVLVEFDTGRQVNILVAKPEGCEGCDYLSDLPGGWNKGDVVYSTVAQVWDDGDKIDVGDKGIVSGAGMDDASVYVHFPGAKIDQGTHLLSTEPVRPAVLRPRSSFHDIVEA